MQDQHDVWEKIAESFHHTRTKPWPLVLEYISNISKESTTVDLGCGNGRHTIPLAHHSKHVYAIDFSQNLLQISKQQSKQHHLQNITYIQADLSTLPLTTSSCDNAIMIASLHNIEQRKNRINALKELSRILKPGGTALLTVWNRQHKAYTPNVEPLHEQGDTIIHWTQHGLNEPRFYHLYTIQELQEDIRTAGLTIQTISERPLNQHNTNKDNIVCILKRENTLQYKPYLSYSQIIKNSYPLTRLI